MKTQVQITIFKTRLGDVFTGSSLIENAALMSCERPWMHHRWVCNHARPSQHQRPVSANKHESVRTLCLEISLVLLLTSSDASGCSLLDCVNYPTCLPQPQTTVSTHATTVTVFCEPSRAVPSREVLPWTNGGLLIIEIESSIKVKKEFSPWVGTYLYSVLNTHAALRCVDLTVTGLSFCRTSALSMISTDVGFSANTKGENQVWSHKSCLWRICIKFFRFLFLSVTSETFPQKCEECKQTSSRRHSPVRLNALYRLTVLLIFKLWDIILTSPPC